MMIFKNCTFYNDNFEKETADIEIDNGIIKKIATIKKDGKDMSAFTLVPGFIDIHIHGSAGGDACDASDESLDKMSKELARHGVTSFCPTTMTLGKEPLCNIVSVISNHKAGGAKIAGINLEGPFISKEKKGAQNANFIRKGTIEEFNRIFDCAKGKVKLITIAPEAFDSEQFINYASKKCTVSIGHSNANSKECKAAFDAGIRQATHLFNAMTPMSHREAGIAGTALDDERIMCELICDGGHICPAVLRNAFKILGEDRAVVISDSMRGAGLGCGKFELGGQAVFVEENGKYATLSDGTIAASITNIHQEFKNLICFGIDFKTALKACTINPARAIKEDSRIGSIKAGKCADLVFLDENLDIKEVYINGILA
ncbi:MAG: N-acetylglucosamine-6-phosphate deacetylase [Eubacterium sp.]